VQAMEIASGYSSQEEYEGVYHGSTRGSFVSRVAVAAFGVVGLVGVGAAVAFHASAKPAAMVPEPVEPLTVRALLESDELTDLATDNLMAMGDGGLATAGRDQVRAGVARGLMNVSSALRTHYPEAHRQLELLQLSSAQKDASLRVIRKFGDARMVGLAHDLAEATRQAEEEGQDQESVRRRLSEVLAPRAREVQQLSEEMFPGQGLTIDAGALSPQLRKWHAAVEVDLGSAPAARKERRLSEVGDSIAQGVQVHAHTLFKSLQGELGDKMPTAPARMLSDGPGPDSSGDKDPSFMVCMMKAMPSPPKIAKCMADNMSEVMKMMKDFMTGKMR